jgi:hypothetical protein
MELPRVEESFYLCFPGTILPVEFCNMLLSVMNSTYLIIIDMRGPDGRDYLSGPHHCLLSDSDERLRLRAGGWSLEAGALSSYPLLLLYHERCHVYFAVPHPTQKE